MEFRRHQLSGKRRTPVPVAPPRIPTPMPPIGNNNNSTKTNSIKDVSRSNIPQSLPDSPHLISKMAYTLDNDIKTAWINPRLMSKIDMEKIISKDYKPSAERNMNGHQYHQHQQQHFHHHQQAMGHYNHNLSHHKLHKASVGVASAAAAAADSHSGAAGLNLNGGSRSKSRTSIPSITPPVVSLLSVPTLTAHQPPATSASSAALITQPNLVAHKRSIAPRTTTRLAASEINKQKLINVDVKTNKQIIMETKTNKQIVIDAKTKHQIYDTTSVRHNKQINSYDQQIIQQKTIDRTYKTIENYKVDERSLIPRTLCRNKQVLAPPNHQIINNDKSIAYQSSSTAGCFIGGVVSGGSGRCDNNIFGVYSETKYTFAVNGLPGSQAQASAAAAFFARAAQKLNLSSSPHRRKRTSSENEESTTGFCGALQRSPPPVPPALLRRIGVKEITGVGKVKVMLRVSAPTATTSESGLSNSFFSLDKRKKQVTLIDPTACGGSTAPEDRRVGVAAPKMFAFDAIFSQDDSQTEICSSALTDVIHAVINGTDGCLFCFGHPGLGKSYTMLGTPENANTLGIIPCAISWLFRGINEQKQKTGARFSVRVSAVEVSGPTNQLRDLLAGHANDSEQSPGVYLRDDPLFGNQHPQCELRVPTAEKAAHYLDAAIECRAPSREDARNSHLLFTLHVYQYSVAGKGGVAGGRSRLHLIDLGNSERGKASGGIPLSGLGNILLAIFNGQKHLPYKEHKLTHLLKDCLSSLTCHAAMIVHVSPHAQNYSDTLTTVQLASRIHRMRRRRIKFVNVATGNGSGGSSGEEPTRTTGTSSEPDPSSSDLSADTVIYVGPSDDATDGEHPPVYIPSLNSGDNRCVMSKALRGSSAEQRPSKVPTLQKQETPTHRTPIKACQTNKTSPAHTSNTPKSSPARVASSKSKQQATAAASVQDSPKHSANGASDEQWIDGPRISKSKVAEARHFMKEPCHVKKRETWIDGPMQAEATTTTASPSSAAAAAAAAAGYGYMDNHKKNMIRKWVEHQTSQIIRTKVVTPTRQSEKTKQESIQLTQFKQCDLEEQSIVKPLIDSKKHELVEECTIRTGLKTNKAAAGIIHECNSPEEREEPIRFKDSRTLQQYEDEEDEEPEPTIPPALPLIQPLSSREVSLESLDQLLKERQIYNAEYNNLQTNYDDANYDDDEDYLEDEILEIIEVEEPLEPVPTQDSCLQVTEEDIAFCMGLVENPLPEVDQENPLDHPLRILSQENLTVVSTFTDSMSVYTDLERILPRHKYDPKYGFYNDDYDDPDNPRYGMLDESRFSNLDESSRYSKLDETSKKKFDQLARLHELYTNRLAKANVANSETFQQQKHNHKVLTRCESLSLTDMLYGNNDNSSIYSEPAYLPDQEKFCQNCQVSISSRPATAQNWYTDPILSASTMELSKQQTQTIGGRFQRYCHKSVKDSNLAYLRHPDGASNPNLREGIEDVRQPGNGENAPITKEPNFTLPLPNPNLGSSEKINRRMLSIESGLAAMKLTQKFEGYDSGHDSTPRTSKHSPAAISRKAESGYDSVIRDSESSSIDSEPSRLSHNINRRGKCKHKHEKSFCSWFLNPFTCKYIEEPPETHF